jgi:hypothetical protein
MGGDQRGKTTGSQNFSLLLPQTFSPPPLLHNLKLRTYSYACSGGQHPHNQAARVWGASNMRPIRAASCLQLQSQQFRKAPCSSQEHNSSGMPCGAARPCAEPVCMAAQVLGPGFRVHGRLECCTPKTGFILMQHTVQFGFPLVPSCTALPPPLNPVSFESCRQQLSVAADDSSRFCP